jgi:hypothetical protein
LFSALGHAQGLKLNIQACWVCAAAALQQMFLRLLFQAKVVHAKLQAACNSQEHYAQVANQQCLNP